MVIVFSPTIGTVLALPPAWVWTLVVAAMARYLFNVVLTLCQLRGRVFAYTSLALGQTVLAATLSLIMVVGLGYGWEGRVSGDIVSFIACSIVAVALLVAAGYMKNGVSGVHLVHALKFGGGLLPHLYGGAPMAGSYCLFIPHLLCHGETGLYASSGHAALSTTVVCYYI